MQIPYNLDTLIYTHFSCSITLWNVNTWWRLCLLLCVWPDWIGSMFFPLFFFVCSPSKMQSVNCHILFIRKRRREEKKNMNSIDTIDNYSFEICKLLIIINSICFVLRIECCWKWSRYLYLYSYSFPLMFNVHTHTHIQ